MKKASALFGSLVVIVISALFLVGCGHEDSSAPKSAANIPLPEPPCVVSCEPGIPGGRMVIATSGDPKTFNPITGNESTSEQIYRLLFWGLVNFDLPTATILPGLAESWNVAADQRTWTFKLRKNLFWSDGKPLTAEDVVFTFNDAIYNPDVPNPVADGCSIDKTNFTVTKIDDLTVQIVTPAVYAPFLESVGTVAILPKHALADDVKNKRFGSSYGVNSRPDQIVCNGPFRIKAFKQGEYTLLERNPYFLETDKKGQRLPYLDTIVYSVVPSQNAVSLQFLSGKSDANEHVIPDEYDHYLAESKTGKFIFLDLGTVLEREFFWFNENTGTNSVTGKPYVDPKRLKLFRKQKFRQAVAYAVDRESIVKAVYEGHAVPNYTYVTEGNPKWRNTNVMTYPYDLEKARALLAEIGISNRDTDGFLQYPEGGTIELIFNTNVGNPVREKESVMLLEDFKKLGLKVIYQPVDFNALIDRLQHSFNYDIILMGLGGAGIDPVGEMNVLKSSGFTHFWFPNEKTPSTPWEARIDELMGAQIKTLDFNERKKDFDEVQAIMAEQAPFVFTAASKSFVGVNATIGNLRPTVLSYYRLTWNAEELYFKKK